MPASQSPADRQAQAIEDVERIAREMFGVIRSGIPPWDRLQESERELWCGHVRHLLLCGVIAVGRRPEVEPTTTGQLSIAP